MTYIGQGVQPEGNGTLKIYFEFSPKWQVDVLAFCCKRPVTYCKSQSSSVEHYMLICGQPLSFYGDLLVLTQTS